MQVPQRLKPFVFPVRFLLLLAIFYIPFALDPVDKHVIEPFSHLIAAVSAMLLKMIGQPVAVSGATIFTSMHAVAIKNGCNGIEAAIFIVAATLAFPASWRWRAAGAAMGIVLIQGLNLLRVVTLFLLQVYKPSLFDLFHLAIWQTIIGGATIGFFYAWTRSATAAAARTHDR